MLVSWSRSVSVMVSILLALKTSVTFRTRFSAGVRAWRTLKLVVALGWR